MKNNILSMEGIVEKANDRLRKAVYFNNNLIRPLKDVALSKELISEDSNFDSGIYLFEQGLLEYGIDKRTQLCGFFGNTLQQEIRGKITLSQVSISQLVKAKGKWADVAPNIQKLLMSDVLISSMSDYGICYDFSKIESLLKSGRTKEAEDLAARDLFFLKTYDYFFKTQKVMNIASKNALSQTRSYLTADNMLNMDRTVQTILRSNGFSKKAFPNDLQVTLKYQKEKSMVYKDINGSVNRDLNRIREEAMEVKNKKENNRVFI